MYRRTKTDYRFSLDKLFLSVVIVPIRLIYGFRSFIIYVDREYRIESNLTVKMDIFLDDVKD
jgi:hypothetical protein